MTAATAKPLEIDLGIADSQVVSAKTGILYGDSTLGKSTQLAEAAQWFYAKHRKPVCLISAEDSSKQIFEPLIHAGIVKALFMPKSLNPVSSLRKLSRGEWLVEDKFIPWNSDACAYIIEGITSIAELIQEDCRDKLRFLGEQKDQAVQEAGETLALPGKFSYNFTQLEMIRLLRSFAMIPGIERVLWSAHESRGVEEGTGQQIRGPALVGTAKTGSILKYCGLLLHLDGYAEKKGSGNDTTITIKRRIWYDRHPDLQVPGLQYPAKVTLPVSALGLVNRKFPGGYFDSVLTYTGENAALTPNLADFLAVEAEALEYAKSKLSEVK